MSKKKSNIGNITYGSLPKINWGKTMSKGSCTKAQQLKTKTMQINRSKMSMKNQTRRDRPIITTFLLLSFFASLCASAAYSQAADLHKSSADTIGTSGTISGMSWEIPDSASANGTVPTMGWDTTATTGLKARPKMQFKSGGRFSLDGIALPNSYRGIIINDQYKILIKQ